MRAVAKGDHAAFGRLYDCLCAATYAILRRHLPVQEDADRAMTAMWVYVWQNAREMSSQPGSTAAKIVAAARTHATVSVTSVP